MVISPENSDNVDSLGDLWLIREGCDSWADYSIFFFCRGDSYADFGNFKEW